MIRKVDTSMNFKDRELEVLKFWKTNGVFEKSVKQREGCPEYTFYDGPPTANGKPHIGHVETRAFKDLLPRFHTMKGKHVLRKAGWDTHGLPVELEVEKQLGLDGKPQIEKYGVEPFIQKCKESVWKYKGDWERMSERVGFWADTDNPYITYDNKYIESVWWAFKKIHSRGLLYKGHKVVPYCPRCGTALSSHEVAQGYKDVTDTTAYVKFRVKGEDNVFFLAWTTTPWTLPSNVALIVNAKEEYCRVRVGGETFILASALAAVLFEGAEIIARFAGRSLENKEYEPLFAFTAVGVSEKAWFVCCDDYVTLSDGTGIVHCAPAFGEDDARVGRAYGLPFVQLVDTAGRFVQQAAPYGGQFVKDADPAIIKDLRAAGLLIKTAPYEHSYPFCWRCDTPLIYYARQTWFIQVTAVKDRLTAANASVNWLPDNIKEGRMGNFIDNVIDWGVSRERYWGTPLPVWECGCGAKHVVGSIEELIRMGRNVPADIELHKPFIDAIALICPACGGDMKRVPEVVDCWFDSGSMPFAQWHYPFENEDKLSVNFPADFISEAVDQTRGWFYTLLAISTLLFDTAPFKNCIVLGHVGDKDGIKMSKHKGNVVDPWDVLDRQGADAVRWFFYVASAPWLPCRFSHDAIDEVQRKFMGTLWNTYAFFALYAEIEGFDPGVSSLESKTLAVMDRWVLSRLNSLISTVDEEMSAYHVTESARAITAFVDELSNWYVRRCRERFWGKSGDDATAFDTLHHVLLTLAKLIAPFVPFMAESMYQNLSSNTGEPISVHLCDYPIADAARIDPALERDMEAIIRVCELGRSARAEKSLKIRQPLARMMVAGVDAPGEDMAAIARAEVNVAACEFITDARAFTGYKIKPNLKTLGKKYGKLLPAIGVALASADGSALVDELAQNSVVRLVVDGTACEFSPDDLLIEKTQREGFASASSAGITVALDTALTPALIAEGYVREVVSKLQTMRKDAGLAVTDRVRVALSGDTDVLTAVFEARDSVASDVLAISIDEAEDEGAKSWDINGRPVSIAVRKA